MTITVVRAIVLVIALVAAWKVIGKEARLRIRQKRWSDVAATSLVFAIVALFSMAAIFAILHATGLMERLADPAG